MVWRRVYERYRKAVIAGRLLRITGRIERDGIVVHVIADSVEDLSTLLSTLGRPIHAEEGNARPDIIQRAAGGNKGSSARHPRAQAKNLFPSRDFH